MTFEHAFWILSAIAAALFFVAGYAAGQSRERVAPEREAIPPEVPSREDANRETSTPEAPILVATDREAPAASPALSHTSGSGSTFQAMLARIGDAEGIRSAVLADNLGLPIASIGDQPESLAGFSGFLWQSAARAAEFLPLGPIRQIRIEDDERGTVTACHVAGSELVLATLSSGPGPELRRMVQILNEASSYLTDRSAS